MFNVYWPKAISCNSLPSRGNLPGLQNAARSWTLPRYSTGMVDADNPQYVQESLQQAMRDDRRRAVAEVH